MTGSGIVNVTNQSQVATATGRSDGSEARPFRTDDLTSDPAAFPPQGGVNRPPRGARPGNRARRHACAFTRASVFTWRR